MKFKIGDLVICVRACSDTTRNHLVGKVGIVEKFGHSVQRCRFCKHPHGVVVKFLSNPPKGWRSAAPEEFLQKIDPPEDGETTEAYLELVEKQHG